MVFATAALMTLAAVDYVRRAWKRETNPVPATWILMMVMMSLSFWMYWVSPQKSWTGNIGVTAGILNIIIILVGVLAVKMRDHVLHVAFDKVQKWCLAFGGAVVVFWFLTKAPLIAYTLVQCIALIAYFATVKRLWNAERSTEPYFIWAAVLCANLCALYPAWVRSDTFAWIYLSRAIPSTIFMIFLIARVKRRVARVEFASAQMFERASS